MRRKLFVVETYQGDRWVPVALYKGTILTALSFIRQDYEVSSGRVKRVKTPAECDQYMSLPIYGEVQESTEWKS